MKISDNFELKSPQEIEKFINDNEKTVEILNAMEPHLKKYFPKSRYTLEVCDKLDWTTETKLLVNIQVDDNMFFNGMIDHMNDIYKEIEPMIREIICPIVLFPELKNKKLNEYKIKNNSTINLVARMAYFNDGFEQNELRELTLREIPKEQQIKEIIEYCKTHQNPDLSDIVYDLRLDLFDVDDIIDELEENGMKLNVKY